MTATNENETSLDALKRMVAEKDRLAGEVTMTDGELLDECEWHTGKTFRLDRIDNSSTCQWCAEVAETRRLRLRLVEYYDKADTGGLQQTRKESGTR